MVSLPKEWVDANNLTKSSQIELDMSDNTIYISAARQDRPARELVISYPLPAEENITADITGGYLLGYDANNHRVQRDHTKRGPGEGAQLDEAACGNGDSRGGLVKDTRAVPA